MSDENNNVKITYAQATEIFTKAMDRLTDLEHAWQQVAPILQKLREAVYSDVPPTNEDTGIDQFKIDSTVWLDKFVPPKGEENDSKE
jgi:hypothetical protein